MPAISKMTLTPVQTIELLVGTLPTNGSDGKLLVYEIVWFGRFAADAHDVQKKKVTSFRIRSGSLWAPL